MNPIHENSGESLSESNSPPPILDDSNIDPIYDINIAALRPAAAGIWQSKCASCHGNRAVKNLDNMETELLSGTLYNHGSSNSKWTINRTNRNAVYTMPTGGTTLSDLEISSLNDWISAVVAKKEAIEADVVGCESKTNYKFADIQNLLRENNINYNSQSVNCQSCHGNNSQFGAIVTYAQTTSLAIARQPQVSIIIDALRPGTGSSPSPYHLAPSASIDKLESWIEGCMPQ